MTLRWARKFIGEAFDVMCVKMEDETTVLTEIFPN